MHLAIQFRGTNNVLLRLIPQLLRPTFLVLTGFL